MEGEVPSPHSLFTVAVLGATCHVPRDEQLFGASSFEWVVDRAEQMICSDFGVSKSQVRLMGTGCGALAHVPVRLFLKSPSEWAGLVIVLPFNLALVETGALPKYYKIGHDLATLHLQVDTRKELLEAKRLGATFIDFVRGTDERDTYLARNSDLLLSSGFFPKASECLDVVYALKCFGLKPSRHLYIDPAQYRGGGMLAPLAKALNTAPRPVAPPRNNKKKAMPGQLVIGIDQLNVVPHKVDALSSPPGMIRVAITGPDCSAEDGLPLFNSTTMLRLKHFVSRQLCQWGVPAALCILLGTGRAWCDHLVVDLFSSPFLMDPATEESIECGGPFAGLHIYTEAKFLAQQSRYEDTPCGHALNAAHHFFSANTGLKSLAAIAQQITHDSSACLADCPSQAECTRLIVQEAHYLIAFHLDAAPPPADALRNPGAWHSSPATRLFVSMDDFRKCAPLC